MIDVDVFDNDERIIVNKACEGAPIADFTRTGFLSNLKFARSISTEQDVIDTLDGLISKTERISDEEWSGLKSKIPFDTYYDTESNVGDVPQDEAI